MAVCIINLAAIPMLAQLRSDRSAPNQAFLVKIPNPTGKTSAYYFVYGANTLAQLDRCPLTRKNRHYRVDLSTLPESYFDALMNATESTQAKEQSSPNGEALEEAWDTLDELARRAGAAPFSWGIEEWFEEINFEHADYSSVDSRVQTVNLSHRDLTDSGNFIRIIFTASNLSHCILNGMICEEANFALANVSDSQFIGTHLKKASFAECNARNANFTGADLRGVNFTDASLSGAIFKHAKIDETTNFSGTRYEGFPNEFFLFIGNNPRETAIQLLQHYLAIGGNDTAILHALDRVWDQKEIDGINFEWMAREAMKSETNLEVCFGEMSGQKIPSVAKMLKFAELTPIIPGSEAPICIQPSPALRMAR